MSTTSAQARPVRREVELDFIRGLAILLVLDFHSPHPLLLKPLLLLGWQHFGWIGVDIFFVLSGFLVGGLLVKERKLRGEIDTKRFLVRRGFKIWPQYYTFLLILLISGHRSLHALWGNLLNIQNYVGGVAHTWTLAVEEQAYILLVLVLALAVRFGTRMRTVFFGTAAGCLCIVLWRFVLAARGENIFSRTDTRVDGILYGVMLAMLYHYVPQVFRRLQCYTWVWVLVILIMLGSFRLNLETWWWPSVSYCLADGSGVAVLLLLYKQRERKRPALYRLVAWIGLYSYGIYLWHVSCIEPLEVLGRRVPAGLLPIWNYLAFSLTGIALGVLATLAVEFPSLRVRDRIFPRRIDSAAGIPAATEQALHLRGVPESVFSSEK